MANKRMFNIKIIDSDAFLDMPLSAQCLYFHLNMRADDDGFIGNPKRVMRTIGAADDDLKLLIAKRFILLFNGGVVVIKHWRIHNCIQGDRYVPTVYQDEAKMLGIKANKAYTLDNSKQIKAVSMSETQCNQNGNILETECNQNISTLETKCNQNVSADIDIDLDKDIDLDIYTYTSKKPVNYKKYVAMYNATCPSLPRVTKLSDARKRAIKSLVSKYSDDEIKRAFEIAQKSNFLKGNGGGTWKATFDWLIKDSNMAKVLDGNYSNKDGQTWQRTDDIDEAALLSVQGDDNVNYQRGVPNDRTGSN